MDRGAARSRKRSHKVDQPSGLAIAGPSQSHKISERHDEHKSNQPKPVGEKRKSKNPASQPDAASSSKYDSSKGKLPDRHPSRSEKIVEEKKEEDPNQYKPKAIRSAHALIYSQSPFTIPPPPEQLTNVTRVDLAGSGAEDVSWLEGLSVTWLSLAGCKIRTGWEAVGSLKDLAVLNISDCGLDGLPNELKSLGKLKAIVAMSNPWTSLDDDVVSSWPELNSSIVSHSPNLASLPKALQTRYHLSKLTFSHSPRLTAASLPDLSALPLLRDIKMNNLPQLTSLPLHIKSWGTGDLALVQKSSAEPSESTSQAKLGRMGDGLEVLDIGNCSLPWDNVSSIFGISIKPSIKSTVTPTKHWSHLRSLTLHSNPLTVSHPNYTELLQQSPNLPNLQIVDSKRIVERKKKGEVSESRAERIQREKREKKMKPSGANVFAGGGEVMRKWGTEAEDDVQPQQGGAAAEGSEVVKVKHAKIAKEPIEGHKKSSKKRRREEQVAENLESEKPKRSKLDAVAVKQDVPSSKPIVDTSDPSTAKATKPKRADQSAVMSVVEVERDLPPPGGKKDKKEKDKPRDKKAGKVVVEKKSAGGVNLKEVFKPKEVEEEVGTGLGVGGW